MNIKKATIKELLDRLAALLKGSRRANPLRDIVKETKRKERIN